MDKSSSVVVEKNNVYVNIIDGNVFLAGEYSNHERAKEIVGEIYALFGVSSRYDMPIV